MDNAYWMMQTDTQHQVLFPLSLERQYSEDVTSWALDPDCLFQIPSLSLTSCVNLEKLLCFSSFIYEMEMAMIVDAHNMQSINISDFSLVFRWNHTCCKHSAFSEYFIGNLSYGSTKMSCDVYSDRFSLTMQGSGSSIHHDTMGNAEKGSKNSFNKNFLRTVLC